MDFALQKKLPFEQILALALLLMAVLTPDALKPFVDTFAYGTSYSRVYGVAAYAAMLAFFKPAVSFASRKVKGFMSGRIKEAFGRIKGILAGFENGLDSKILIFAIAIVFAYGILGQYLFANAIGADDLKARYFAFDERGYTSTHINHIHALKTLFCPFDPSDDIDCARPMLPYLPQFYPFVGLALFLFAWFCAIACYPKMSTASEKIAYFILTFASMKAAVDGGLLNYSSLSFFMLVPFLLAKERKILWTLLGVCLWFPIAYATYEFYDPMPLARPILAIFYPLSIFAIRPKIFFPLLLIAIISPTYVIGETAVVKDRWLPEACANAGANPSYYARIEAKVYTDCNARQEFSCGVVEAGSHRAIYSGYAAKKPELILAKGLASNCTHGVFSITQAYENVRLIGRVD
jgi:hypothetical protein